jgi:hypothetical protein
MLLSIFDAGGSAPSYSLLLNKKFGYQAGSLQWIKEIKGMTKHCCVTTQMASLQEWEALSYENIEDSGI